MIRHRSSERSSSIKALISLFGMAGSSRSRYLSRAECTRSATSVPFNPRAFSARAMRCSIASFTVFFCFSAIGLIRKGGKILAPVGCRLELVALFRSENRACPQKRHRRLGMASGTLTLQSLQMLAQERNDLVPVVIHPRFFAECVVTARYRYLAVFDLA